jgi:hypothetical protein
MQEFAQKDSATPAEQCPSAEDLAAYIDGNLGKEESQRIAEHLASCEDCYAAYTETLRFQLDTESVFAEGEVLPFPPPDKRERALARASAVRQWLPIAALLLVGVGGGTAFQFLARPPGLVPTRLVPPLADPSSLNERLWRGPTYRGEGVEEEGQLDEPPFRMGVQLVNLQASLKAGNIPAAQDVVARILGLLKAQPFTDDLYKAYTGITVALENHKPPSELLPEASRLAKESREVFEPTTPLDLGQWVEAGRLSALAHDPSFFQQPDTRSFLRRFRWREKVGLGDTKLDPVSRESLGRISEIVSKSDLQASDYAELRRQFDKILEIYYPET